ncbi:MAG TPA: hypothetical protein VL442_06795 [Mucilaginibacter sp.]|jgi:hypothetical protein|nr:hypothetical protein [Mucilaginibacter sp.]
MPIVHNINFGDLNNLREIGFRGFKTKAELFQDSSILPNQPGIYFILSLQKSKPTFLEVGTGGYFKGKNPNVSLEELRSNWIEEAIVVYIGKATNLRTRLRQYLKFGQGKNIGHWGGRYIWQLAHSRELVVCWMPTPNDDPENVEMSFIQAFKKRYVRRPFANLVG